MADDQDPHPQGPPPSARPRFPPRPGDPGVVPGVGAPAREPNGRADGAADETPKYTLYRREGPPPGRSSSRGRLAGAIRRAGSLRPDPSRAKPGLTAGVPEPEVAPRRRTRRPFGVRRAVRWLVLGLIAWVVLSGILFVISAQLAPGVPSAARAALESAGWPLTSANTILVLGSDQRQAGSKEAGANTSGPSRSDVILLIRIGGGRSARLSIPRDTVAAIPGHGLAKINAAFAFGGAGLAARTVEAYLGIKINHVVEVNFTNFPGLVDAVGGVDYTGGCVVSAINGGFRNGGYTLRLKAGTTHIDGAQALALARTRKNSCNQAESDLTRARRQQKLFSSIERRVISPGAFIRLPWVAWAAPRAVATDMGAATLLGLFTALETAGSPPTQVLKPTGGVTLADGGAGLVVSAAERRAATARFLQG